MNPYIIPKEVLDALRECILNIFWPKNDVLDFLKSCGSPTVILNKLHSQKHELTRKEIINIAFSQLCQNHDNGIGPIRRMIHELKSWSTFNSIHFEVGGNLDVKKAQHAISHLRKLQESKDSQLREAEKERHKIQQATQRELKAETLKNKFFLLYKGKDEYEKEINFQKRGYLFEALLKDLAVLEGLTTTESFSFNILGEQIDGAIKYDGEHYIIEAKWQEKVVASNALYQFAHKIEGKMYGRGIFISINGFSPESVNALTKGKSLKSILVDGADLILVVEGLYTFSEMLDRKIKAAQTMGNIYVSVYDLKDKCFAA
ncbi:restriction endonuclease [uncultured Pontibacter sp.]|uniref:restriction endonuclease n=1 Tax=uncultured Pontibacter sp. TaxID=453356 RepID=UPI002604539F|nr:restriction endonuclease [uncultured Pontibacter sp.]